MNDTDIAFMGNLETNSFFRIEHKVTDTSCGEGDRMFPATLITTRAIVGACKREFRIQRTIVLDTQSNIPHSEMVREAKAQNTAELWKVAISSSNV